MMICSACDVDLCWMCGQGCACDHTNQNRSDSWNGRRTRPDVPSMHDVTGDPGAVRPPEVSQVIPLAGGTDNRVWSHPAPADDKRLAS
jgi:hypothetical protein